MRRHLTLMLLAAAPTARASDLVEALPLTDRIVMLHFDDGRVEHHRRGEPRSAEKVVADPLDAGLASKPATYALTSRDDPAYAKPTPPTRVGRKSKGTEFAWFVDSWQGGRAVNDRPDHAKEHWIYLVLPAPMQTGKTYSVALGNLTPAGSVRVTFDEARTRSEAVHVNLVGYAPAGPKVASVFHWAGDLGGIELQGHPGRRFRVLDDASGAEVYAGPVRFRLPKTARETEQPGDTPGGNFLGADVWECDFTALTKPGRYRVAVEGVGCSFPFDLGPDVYRVPFRATMRALYHNRSGIELKAPFTTYTRPAPHHPRLTPGFAGKLQYTTVPWREWGSEGGDPKKLAAAFKGPLDAWGWYQDAGDWDSYETHLRVAAELLLAYELAPSHFTDGELNIPESGNGVPDILDEAAWLPRFCYRLRHELLAKGYGSGGVALRVAGDAFGGDEKTLPGGQKVGQGSWEDVNRTWVVAGADAHATYRYAGAAAQLALALERVGKPDPEGVDWAKEAREAFDWAEANTGPDGQADKALAAFRAYAAAALYRLTGEARYETVFLADTKSVNSNSLVDGENRYAVWLYCLGGKSSAPADLDRLRAAVIHTADVTAIETPARRALKWGGNPYFPMLVGQQTTPMVLDAAVARALAARGQPLKAKAYLDTLVRSCDYVLGANSLNMTWVTGVGPRSPAEVFHLDAWYNGGKGYHPGLIPYGPWKKQKALGQGPWDSDWPNATVYPAIDQWPGNERWFSNRCSPTTGEFTVHQNIAPAAAVFGVLCAPVK